MYNSLFNPSSIKEVKKLLLKKQKNVSNHLKSLEKGDPFLSSEYLGESVESGTYSWEADVHTSNKALKDNLLKISSQVNECLDKIQRGTYGLCAKCGKKIDDERLKAIPLTTLCISCTKTSKFQGVTL